jgi:general secretion pathway protein C
MSSDLEFQEKPKWKQKFQERLRGLLSVFKGGPKGASTATRPSTPTSIGSLVERTMTTLVRKLRKNDPRQQAALLTLRRQNVEFYAKGISLLWVAYILADWISLSTEKYIPLIDTPRRASRSMNPSKIPVLTESAFEIIVSRNLFSSKGVIPGEGGDAETPNLENMAPVKTSLPFNLVGTLILRNELKSIGTIEDKSANQVYPVRVDDEIPGKARILSVEASRVVFFNPQTQAKEFVEMLEGPGAKITLGTKNTGGPKLGAQIEQVAPTQFNLPRTEIDRALSDLNKILTEARAIPYSENGQPAGFKLIQIVPGSIYEKLGLRNEDVLCGINGEPIVDPGKAFELLNQLKTSSHMELCVKRGGKALNYAYDIR